MDELGSREVGLGWSGGYPRMSGSPYAHYDHQGVPGGAAAAVGPSAYGQSKPAGKGTLSDIILHIYFPVQLRNVFELSWTQKQGR